MKKDLETTIAYWKDPGDGSGPDANFDAELFFGHHDEDIRKVTVRDIRESESEYSLDTHGFTVRTLSPKERPIPNTPELQEQWFDEIAKLIKEE